MRKYLFLLVAISLLWTFQASENVASAHGGTYRGPAGEVPPGQRDPKDPQPPPEAPGTPTPGQDGPGTPPDAPNPTPGGDAPPPSDSPRPTPPAPSGPTGGPPGGGVATPGGRVAPPKPMSFENWLFWWSYNKDEILNLKSAIMAMDRKVSTQASPHFFGDSGDKNRSETERPTEALIKSEIVPALEQTVADKGIHPDIRGGALIALARASAGESTHIKTFFEVGAAGAGEDKVVQESAILALGIQGEKDLEIRDFLIKLIDNSEVSFRARCFALLSLGLLQDNDPAVFECIERRLDGSESTPDVPICALLTVGLIGDSARVPNLVKWLDEGRIGRKKLGDLEKAYIVSALGKIGHPDAMKPVADTLRKKGLYTRRSAFIAFGQILPQAEPKVQGEYVKKLAAYLKSEGDSTAKNFGIISLGRLGGQADASEQIRSTCEKILTDQFKNGSKATVRPFAALALGLMAFEGDKESSKPQDLKERLDEMIRKELRQLRGDKVALGAQAIALGMIGQNNPETVKLLIKILKDRGLEKKLRGAAAVALGLIGNNEAKGAIVSALKEREDRDLRVDTAVAAGLLADSSAVTELVTVLGDRKASQFVLGSVALALGQIGDARAIGPMKKILEPGKTNGTYPDLTRALVAVALGQLSDRREIRVLYRLSKDINYRASVSAMDEALTIL